MDKLNKDELFFIATKMQLKDIISLCESSKIINEKICRRTDIWYFLLKRDFPNETKNFDFIISPSERYIFLYSLNKFKNKYFPNETLLDIYNKTEIDLSNKKLNEVPKIIPHLINLRTLNLNVNRIKEIPESLGNLTNLEKLSLGSNKIIKEIPEFLGNLTNLHSLYLPYNQIKEIPESLGNLTNLQSLFLHDNQIKEIPESLENLINLQELHLYNNKIKEIPESLKRFKKTI